MPDANLNAWWGRILAETLAAAGCAHAVLCPGSRNSPLLFQLAEIFAGRTTVHWDERAAGFLALGHAKALGQPVVVCVTSGTAVANLLPAVCEADAAGVPLVALTADRPPRLHGCGAPQTMPQQSVFGGFAEALDLGLPTADGEARLRTAVFAAVAPARRPVQLNVALDDPLPPIPDGWIAPPPAAWTPPAAVARRCIVPELPALAGRSRGLIVAGSAEAVPHDLVVRLADTTGYPVLADAASNLRRPAVPHCVACPAAAYARPPGEPELILRLGPPPLTRAGYEWLARQRCPQLVLSGPRDDDFLRTATARIVEVDHAAVEALLAQLTPANDAWRAAWTTGVPKAPGWDATAVAGLVANAEDFPLLWLASSMPIRDADLMLAPRAWSQRILANRGLNGIDGTIAAFAGAARALGTRGLLLIGDLATLHDLTSLALLPGLRGGVVVVDNGGGAIFEALPVAQVPGWRPLVRADHAWGFAHAAAQFGLPYRRCADRASLAAALAEAARAADCLVIHADVRASDGIAAHRAALASALA